MAAGELNLKDMRNIGIIAHIDAGKTTVTERILFYTGITYKIGEVHEGTAVMDWMEQEQERGITITSAATTCFWTPTYLPQEKKDKQNEYRINIIDTPGHVDFAYEVSRSLAACEGALLVVDVSQGVEAQTVANCYTAIEQGVTVVPVLNKIDLPSADPANAIQEIEDVIGIRAQDALRVSAKTGEGVQDILEAVIARIPAPSGDP